MGPRSVSRLGVLLLVLASLPGTRATATVGSSRHGAAPVSGSSDFNGDGYADLASGAWLEDVGTLGKAGGVNVLYGSAAGLDSTGNQFWTQDSAGVPDQAESTDWFGSSLTAADFDGDGFSDLAIGVQRESYRAIDDGVVNILYGSAAGLSGDRAQLWSQASPGILDAPEDGDHFGATLGAGDFNGDGYADLLVGTPDESVGTVDLAGAVNVIYGSAGGLTAVGNQFWTQDSPGVLEKAETFDFFGGAVAGGDLNGDGYDDMAVSAMNESVNQQMESGKVSILFGSAAGLTAEGDQIWSQNSPGILDQSESGDHFGYALAAGDLDGDGFSDLVIGVPGEDDGIHFIEGSANVLYGSAAGIVAVGNQFWNQDSPGILEQQESYDNWASAVDVGDFNGDGFDDLAVGSFGDNYFAGLVNLIYGSATGLTDAGNQVWSQDSPGILDQEDSNDNLGFALYVGDADGDGFDDLGAGVYGEGKPGHSGAVTFLYGSSSGIASNRNQLWTQDSPDILDQAEAGDQFGYALG